MTIEELLNVCENAAWFKNVGTYVEDADACSIKNLEAWGDTDSVDEIADAMTWLPSSLTEKDPFHDWARLKNLPEYGGCPDAAKQVYQATLLSLRRMFDSPLFHVGSSNFYGAAKGAALFAFRSAALECKSSQPGPWIRIVKYYHAGFWPCGTLPDKRIVVL